MWTQDDFPTGPIPWQLLIRARYVHEVDAVLGSVVLRTLEHSVSRDSVARIAHAADAAVFGREPEKVGADQSMSALSAVADFDDRCGTPWPGWRGPRPHWLDAVSDPVSVAVIGRAQDLVATVGSEALQKTLGSTLAELATGQLR